MKAEEKATLYISKYPDGTIGFSEVAEGEYIVEEREITLEYANQQPEVDYQKMFANCSLPNEKQPEQDKVREAAEKVVCLYDSDYSKTKDHERVFDEAIDDLRKALNQNKQR
jgi:hypothetical protein